MSGLVDKQSKVTSPLMHASATFTLIIFLVKFKNYLFFFFLKKKKKKKKKKKFLLVYASFKTKMNTFCEIDTLYYFYKKTRSLSLI